MRKFSIALFVLIHFIGNSVYSQNQELIDSINGYVPEYVGETGKAATRVFCVLGIGKGSCIVNNDIELSISVRPAKQEKSSMVNTKYSYADPQFIVTVKNKTSETLNVAFGSSTASVPPKSSETLDGQSLFVENGWFCDGLKIVDYATNIPKLPCFYFKKSKDDADFEFGNVLNYSESTSPVKFSVSLSYSTKKNPETKTMNVSLFVKNIIGIGQGWSESYNNCDLRTNIPTHGNCIYFVGRNMDRTSYVNYKTATFFPRQ